MAVRTEALLDKLYNLRGEDSSILKEMDEQRIEAEETKEKTTEQKKVLQNKIADLKTSREELEAQGEKFKTMLQGINREDYETVLTRLQIDFDPEGLLAKLNKNLPKTIETVDEDTKKSEEELVKVEEQMNKAITTIEELGIRKDSALANQEKLNEYIELALSGNINITRDSITSLLAQFHFTEEEQREAAKILMFPEDALFSYDEKIKSKDKFGKSISEVIHEARTISEEQSLPIEENKKDVKDEVIDTLKKVGIDYLDFTSDELNNLMNHFDEKLFTKNVNLITDEKINKDIFIGHASLLYDEELQDKIELLLKVGKEPTDLYLNPNVLSKYNLEALKRVIETIITSHMEPKNVPLMAY